MPTRSNPGTQGYNLYAYVANNPTTWVDPSGYSAEPALSGDDLLLAMMYAMSNGLIGIFECALIPGCMSTQDGFGALIEELGSQVPGYIE